MDSLATKIGGGVENGNEGFRDEGGEKEGLGHSVSPQKREELLPTCKKKLLEKVGMKKENEKGESRSSLSWEKAIDITRKMMNIASLKT